MPVAVNIMNLPEDSTNSMENAGQAVKDRQGEMDSKMERTCWEK